MTDRTRSQQFPDEFAYKHTDIPRRAGEPRAARARHPTTSAPAPTAEAIQFSGYRVIVTEHRSRDLVGTDGITYASPPHTEPQARALIALLVDGAVHGGGPWRHPIAGGQRIIELEHPS